MRTVLRSEILTKLVENSAKPSVRTLNFYRVLRWLCQCTCQCRQNFGPVFLTCIFFAVLGSVLLELCNIYVMFSCGGFIPMGDLAHARMRCKNVIWHVLSAHPISGATESMQASWWYILDRRNPPRLRETKTARTTYTGVSVYAISISTHDAERTVLQRCPDLVVWI